MNPLLTRLSIFARTPALAAAPSFRVYRRSPKEAARGRLSTAAFHTSPDPSFVRRGTLDERFIGSSERKRAYRRVGQDVRDGTRRVLKLVVRAGYAVADTGEVEHLRRTCGARQVVAVWIPAEMGQCRGGER
jgi:hypothetical protein